ncbi:MAG: glycosyltransferase [Acidobacteria bacterium]|nr:glycosyltransferase [Acidobacteriota bacterium]NIM61493.1 glycosyltransferase [Acidobacteriota bacterium]NIO58125.1 glycosyltransferase [Acidobacteriota bacterium]NIQ29137.1 glycosyltransferase [Acidobacteriota bacterium]NIQ83688.1 glycosyltransferase [Acidobacteriota bacterium]
MKILLYGEPLNPGTGSWCYYETLREMGHEVVHCSSWEGLGRYTDKLAWRLWWRATRRVFESHRLVHVRRLLREAAHHRPDIVLVLKGLHVGPREVRALKRDGAWVAIINHDDFFSLNPANVSAVQRAALPEWDFVFATREANVAEVRPSNPNVEFFRFAYYPRIHRPVAVDPATEPQWVSDVVFVGTWEKERAALMEQLVRRVDADVAVWGSQWHKLAPWSPLRRHVRGTEIYLDDQCRAIGAAKISLGFLRKKNRDFYTVRTFEIPACNGVLLGERTDVHRSIYREGVEAEFFDASRPEDLAEAVRRLLADDDHREGLRRAGREAVGRGRHTYRDRLDRLLEVYRQQRGAPSVEGARA